MRRVLTPLDPFAPGPRSGRRRYWLGDAVGVLVFAAIFALAILSRSF